MISLKDIFASQRLKCSVDIRNFAKKFIISNCESFLCVRNRRSEVLYKKGVLKKPATLGHLFYGTPQLAASVGIEFLMNFCGDLRITLRLLEYFDDYYQYIIQILFDFAYYVFQVL